MIRKYFSIGFVSVLVLLGLIVSSSANADIGINSVSLNGGNTTTVVPSGTVSVSVNVTGTGSGDSNDWRSTSWDIIPDGKFSVCVNTADHTNGGNNTESFNITAPSSVGQYDVVVNVYRQDNCVSERDSITKDNGIKVQISDTTAPETTINSNPSNPTNLNSATFTFSSNESGTFECKLDAGTFSTCTTPKTYTGLSEGSHTFEVRAKDLALNIDPTPASYSWNIDFTSPTSSVTSPSADALLHGTVTIEADASDTGSGISKVEFYHSSPTPGVKIGEATTAPYSFDWNTTSVSDGSHSIWVVAIDNAGNSTISTSVSVMVDNTAPTLHLPSDITAEATKPEGAEVSFGEISASDTNPEVPVVTCAPVSGSTFPLGDTTVSCEATDTAGNTATGTFNVKIQDTTAPVITAPKDQTFEATGPTTTPTLEPATATDIADANPVIDYSPKDFPIGETEVTWTATDDTGNIATITSKVIITDTTAPKINVASSDSIDTWQNESFSEPDCTATDLVDGEVKCEITSNDVDTGKLGTYHIIYKATDAAGNSSEKTIEVNVVDKVKPIITRTGLNVTIEGGDSYEDEGATAEDKIGDDITESIVTTGLPVNTLELGEHEVFYDVTDSWGTSATQAKRVVTVIDTTAPIVSVLGENPITIKIGDSYEDAGATASDIISGDLTSSIEKVGEVNTEVADTYTITYSVSDGSGNKGTATRTVIVRRLGTNATLSALSLSLGILNPVFNSETLEYTVTLPYQTTATPEVSATPTDPNASVEILNASDVTSQDIANRTTTITVKSEDKEITKIYTIIFNVSGKPDTTNPEITVLGENPVTIRVGSTYEDAGATALDDIDGDITKDIEVKNDVDTDQVGTYLVTYDVMDKSGNEANQMSRTVIVERRPVNTNRVIGGMALGGSVLGAEKYNFTLDLRLGSHGAEVRELQKFLSAAGYDCGKVDGFFGPLTKAAVIKFQLANKLAGDGIVGPLTRAVLNK